MKFTDIFIRRPVLAMALSLLVLVLGLRSLYSLPVNEFPHTENAVVTVSTTYFGADAQTIAGFITQPLEAAIAQAQGIDYLSSTSTSGVSTITATLRLNYDSNRALTEINTQVNSVRNQLPPQTQVPVLTVQIGQTVDTFWLDDVLKISAVEQTAFLARLAHSQLPFPVNAQMQVRDIAKLEQGDDWVLYGKTGWTGKAQPSVGWFVGWIEQKGNIYSFALNMDIPDETFLPKRKEVAKASLRALGLL